MRSCPATGAKVGYELDEKKSVQVIAEQSGENRTQVQRYIRLTELSLSLSGTGGVSLGLGNENG